MLILFPINLGLEIKKFFLQSTKGKKQFRVYFHQVL